MWMQDSPTPSPETLRLGCPETASIREAMEAIEVGTANATIVVDSANRFLGIVTDGDIRRALLNGSLLQDRVLPYARRHAVTVSPSESRASVLDLMRARSIRQVPVLHADGTVAGVHLLNELIGMVPRPNVAVILAGGRGSRLRPLTEAIPKAMITVAGRPILERIVSHLVGYGITSIVISVGYLAEQIQAHFGDGSVHGCSVTYLVESPDQPLGTGGPLGLVASRIEVGDHPILVMNGDLVTQFAVAELLEHHQQTGAVATIAVQAYAHQVPFGVVHTNSEGLVESLDEKPMLTQLVSTGIYVFDPGVFTRIPPACEYPITDLLASLLASGQRVEAWELEQEWADIGRLDDLARARGLR